MGRTIKVTILDTGQLNIVPQQAFSGENNAVRLDCFCSDALKDYTKYIDFESNGVKYRSPAFTDNSANFVFDIPNSISNYNTLFQFVFIDGDQIIKTQKGTIYVQESVNAVDQITFESGDILDDFEVRISELENKKEIIDITYSEIKILKDNNQLIAGQYYKFEYTTKHQIPNTTVINEGTPEQLIILATSTNTFAKEVYSLSYPKDEIDYDFDNNLCEDDITARTGWITRRKDTIYNNEVVGFDFKNAKFRRFILDLVASGVSEWVYDDAHSKGDLVYNGTEIYVCIKNLVGNPNITETEFWLKICNTTDYICLDSTGLTKIYVNNIEVVLKGNSYFYTDNYLFDYTNESNINNYVKCTVANNNNILGYFLNNTISGEFYNNTISGGFFYNTISGGFFYNTISGEFSYNTISGGFFYNTISGNFYNNTIFGYFSNNTISGEFYNNTISGGFFYNTISGYFSNNTISLDFYKNTISGNFYNNTISLDFYKNTILGYFMYNQILKNLNNIDFSLATHVSTTYNKTIGLNNSDILYLSYVDGDNVQQIVNITD